MFAVRCSLFALCLLPSCSRTDEPAARPAAAPPVPVSVATAERRDWPERLRAIGTVEPLASVTLRPQLSAQLSEARFQEGQTVAQNDVLLLLDARSFEAALHQAQANHARAAAVAADAARFLERLQHAEQEGVTSPRELEQAQSASEAARAAVQAAEAQVEEARLSVERCTIRAPISGRAGTLMVKPGNIVKENETALVDIHQLAPINVSFAIPERHLPAVRRGQEADPAGLPVDATHPGLGEEPISGRLAFLDNKVDTSTGTIRLRATFTNDDHRLWPGEFVEVAFTIAVLKGAVVVPAPAVTSSQRGTTVYVVRGDAVEERPVKVDRTDGQSAVIAEGLKEGETVVTDGQLRLVPGAKVQIKQ